MCRGNSRVPQNGLSDLAHRAYIARHTLGHENWPNFTSSTYVDNVMLWIEESAYRHGASEEEIIHALSNPLRHFELDEMIMITGPDFAGNVLEIGVVESPEYLVVIHAMKARKEFLR